MEHFQETVAVVLAAGEANGGAFLSVPAGKRAVIEHVSVQADPANVAIQANYFHTSTIGGSGAFRHVPVIVVHQGDSVIGSHPLRAYADPGTEWGGSIRRSNTTERLVATFVFAGHYVPFT
jgi:hypothetical protein